MNTEELLEQEEINLLLDKGIEIKTNLDGVEKIHFTKKMTLKRLLELSDVYIKMQIDDVALMESDNSFITEAILVINKNAKLAAKVLAISCEDDEDERVFLADYFLKTIDSKELLDITQKILKKSNYQDFISSIILMNGNRITKPTMIEKTEKKGLNPSTES